MNYSRNVHIQFELRLLTADHMSYTCTLLQYFAGLNWLSYNQAFLHQIKAFLTLLFQMTYRDPKWR